MDKEELITAQFNGFHGHTLNDNGGLHSLVISDSETWGVSITDHNPDSKNYIGTENQAEAVKLQKLLSKLTPISIDKPLSED